MSKAGNVARRRLGRSEHQSHTPKIPLLWDESALTRSERVELEAGRESAAVGEQSVARFSAARGHANPTHG